mmetsp:Transcript_38911/g.92073  ORF Transcript_38911/g.92073 Transcript_38911/m.92073 type:complete len:371 (-) Transcript_38911:13-1125(-)
MLAIGTQGGRIKILNVATKHLRLDVAGHNDIVRCVSMAPDGSCIASASNDCSAKIWSARTGEEMYRLRGHTGRDGCICRMNLVGQVVSVNDTCPITGHGSFVTSVAFSPTGRSLATGGADRTVLLWGVDSWQVMHRLKNHSGTVWTVSFSPDGETIASAGDDQRVLIWSTSTGDVVQTLLGHSDLVRSVAFSPDGTTLASGSHDRSVRVRNAVTGASRHMLQGHRDNVRAVVFSPDGLMLVSCSFDMALRVWDAASGELIHLKRGHDGLHGCICDVRVGFIGFNPHPDCPVIGHHAAVTSVAFSPDGSLLASGSYDGIVKVWDRATWTLQVRIAMGSADQVNTLSFGLDWMTEEMKIAFAMGLDDRLGAA